MHVRSNYFCILYNLINIQNRIEKVPLEHISHYVLGKNILNPDIHQNILEVLLFLEEDVIECVNKSL